MIRIIIDRFIATKLFEWVMTVNMILLGLVCVIFPQTLLTSAFKYMVFIGDPIWFGVVTLIVGIVRLVVLIINGNSIVWGPQVRASCAVFGAMIWFQMFIALAMFGFTNGFPSPELSNWFSLCLGELMAAYIAGRDVRRSA